MAAGKLQQQKQENYIVIVEPNPNPNPNPRRSRITQFANLGEKNEEMKPQGEFILFYFINKKEANSKHRHKFTTWGIKWAVKLVSFSLQFWETTALCFQEPTFVSFPNYLRGKLLQGERS